MEILGMVDIPTWAIILTLLLCLYYRYMTRHFGVFPSMGVKGPRPWPAFGNIHQFMRKGFIEANADWFKKYGKIFGIHEGLYPLLVVGDLDMLKDITVKEFNNFPNRRDLGLRKFSRPPMNELLTFLEDDDWRHNRNWLTPSFSGGKLKRMSGLISDVAKTMVEKLKSKANSGEPINIKQYTGGYAMDAISSTAFGVQVDSQKNPDDEFVEQARVLNEFSLFNPMLIILFFFPFLVPLLRILGFNVFPQKAVDFFSDVTKRVLTDRRKQPADHKDFLQLMVNAEKEAHQHGEIGDEDGTNLETGTGSFWKDKRKGQGLTDSEITAAAIIFFAAGYETTATTLAHVLYHLALNPQCTEKLIDEVDEHFPDGTVPDYDSVGKLPYLEKVISETLRINPPIGRMDRVCNQETTVRGMTIPKDMGVALPIYMIHHDPDYWPDPEKFDPERFTTENRAKHHPLQWIPFGHGPRNCIGMRLALVEMKILLVQLYQKYRFVPNEKTAIPLKFNETVVLSTRGKGVWMTVQNRK